MGTPERNHTPVRCRKSSHGKILNCWNTSTLLWEIGFGEEFAYEPPTRRLQLMCDTKGLRGQLELQVTENNERNLSPVSAQKRKAILHSNVASTATARETN
jgi:hypothetical protein